MGFCLFSFSNFTFDFNGSHLKKLKIIQCDSWTGARCQKTWKLVIGRHFTLFHGGQACSSPNIVCYWLTKQYINDSLLLLQMYALHPHGNFAIHPFLTSTRQIPNRKLFGGASMQAIQTHKNRNNRNIVQTNQLSFSRPLFVSSVLVNKFGSCFGNAADKKIVISLPTRVDWESMTDAK